MRLVGKKILVTGGAGFIGSHLVDSLVGDNEVTVVDNLSSGTEQNIRQHVKNNLVRFVLADILDVEAMGSILRNNEVVLHLAVQNLRLSLFNPRLTHEVNATGSLNLCQASLEAKVEKFVYVSSSEVYGTAKTIPMKENHPLEPTTPYGASKLAGEAYARSYHSSFGLPVVIVRPFNCYGPRAHFEGVYGEAIPRFVLRVINGLPPIIFGDGEQTRDFTDVRDIVRGIVLAAECDALIGQTVNVAAGREVSINEVARIVTEVLGRDAEIQPIHMEPRPGDVRQHYADISKARQILGFQPEIGIAPGIRHYVDWFRNQGWDLASLQQQEKIINWRP